MSETPKLRDPRDSWPKGTERQPSDPNGEAYVTLSKYFPSLADERRKALARLMFAQPRTLAFLERFLREHAPELFV